MKVRKKNRQTAAEPSGKGNPARAGSAGTDLRWGRSFKDLVRQYFDSQSDGNKLTKEELVETALKKAKRGNFFFWSKLVELHEARLVSEDDLQDFIEKVYVTVRRHVEKLDGGRDALAEIARDLQKEIENE